MQQVELTAPRVRLRPHHTADLDGIVDQCADPDTQRWTTVPAPYTRADAERFLAQVQQRWRDGTNLSFALAEPSTDEFLGTVDIRPDGAGAGELGFGLRPGARGQGILPAALDRVATWAFHSDALDLEVLHWRAFVGNWSSRRAVWKVGFRTEGTVRGLGSQRGERRDCWIGSLRRGDPREPAHPWLTAPVIAGPTVRLRPFRESDAASCVEACSDPTTRHWLGDLPDPYTEEVALGYTRTREEEHAKGAGVYWCAADPVDDRCFGSFALMSLSSAGSAEIGYWLHPAARGKGLATEAVRLACAHAFAPAPGGGGLGLRRVDLRTAAGNTASARVAERTGFTRVGMQRGAERLGDGSYDDLVWWDLLAPDQGGGDAA